MSLTNLFLRTTVLFFITCLFILPLSCTASTTVTQKDFFVWQKAQRGILLMEGKKETLILSPQVKGTLKDFAWIIPLPSKPKIKEVASDPLTALTKITKHNIEPLLQNPEGSVVPNESSQTISEIQAENLYETSVLKAKNLEEISTYLTTNNFFLPEEANYLFQEYIDLGWYFILVKVKISEVETLKDQTSFEGYLPPLQLTFSSNNLFYPTKLLKVNEFLSKSQENTTTETTVEGTEQKIAEGQTNFSPQNTLASEIAKTEKVDLLVLSDHQKTLSGFNTLFSDWIDPSKDLSWYETQKEKLFLTQLSGTIELSKLSSDFLLRNDGSKESIDSQKRTGSTWAGAVLFFLTILVILLSPLGLFFILGATLSSVGRTRGGRAWGFIFECFGFLGVAFATGVWYFKAKTFLNLFDFENYRLTQGFSQNYFRVWILSALITALLLILLILIMQIRKAKKPLSETEDPQKSIADKLFDEQKKPSLETEDQTKAPKTTDKEVEVELEKEEPKPPKFEEPKTKKIKVEAQK